MPELRGVRKNSLKNLIKDPATKEAFRNVETRLTTLERRISLPQKVTSVNPQPSEFIYTSGAGVGIYDLILSFFRIPFSTRGGLVFGYLEPQIPPPLKRPRVSFARTGAATSQVSVIFSRDNTEIKRLEDKVSATGATAITHNICPSSFWFLDFVAEGTYTYECKFEMQQDTTFELDYVNFSLIELFPLR